MSTATVAVIAGLFGLIIGSFLNVVIWRLPRGESLAHPGSKCPECDTPIKPWDNIPVLSWVLLRGRCRNCGARISVRYPLVELLTAALYVLVVIHDDAGDQMWIGLVFMTLLVPITFIDLDLRLIPNKLTIPGSIAAVALVAIIIPDDLVEHLIAGATARPRHRPITPASLTSPMPIPFG